MWERLECIWFEGIMCFLLLQTDVCYIHSVRNETDYDYLYYSKYQKPYIHTHSHVCMCVNTFIRSKIFCNHNTKMEIVRRKNKLKEKPEVIRERETTRQLVSKVTKVAMKWGTEIKWKTISRETNLLMDRNEIIQLKRTLIWSENEPCLKMTRFDRKIKWCLSLIFIQTVYLFILRFVSVKTENVFK